jgi:hypothetical protein
MYQTDTRTNWHYECARDLIRGYRVVLTQILICSTRRFSEGYEPK